MLLQQLLVGAIIQDGQQLVAAALEARDDFADQAALHAVRLDHDVRAFHADESRRSAKPKKTINQHQKRGAVRILGPQAPQSPHMTLELCKLQFVLTGHTLADMQLHSCAAWLSICCCQIEGMHDAQWLCPLCNAAHLASPR